MIEIDAPVEVCPNCLKLCDSIRSLNVHFENAHNFSLARRNFECEYCGTEVETYSDTQKVCGDCRGKAISDAKDQGFTEVCEWCGDEVHIEPWELEWKDMFFCDMDCKASWQSENRRGEDNPRWKGGYSRSYGKSWPEQQSEALKRDEFKCRVCGDGVDEIGKNPDVHHITPFRKFDNHVEANSLDNLICLCPTHHQKAEHNKISLPNPQVNPA